MAEGFSQVEGVDYEDTYSPTIRMTTIQLILALATKDNLELRMVDVKGAYLNGKLDNTVCMHQPKGFVKNGEEDLVCKLNKSIFGLKKSGRMWHGTMEREMERIGFTPRKADPTVYIQLRNNG